MPGSPATPRAIGSPSGSRPWSTSTPPRGRERCPRLRRRREAAELEGARGGGEPRRAQRRAARGIRRRAVPEPGAVLREAAVLTKRRATRHSEHGHLHGVHVRAVQGGRQGGVCVARRPDRGAQRDLGRPADEPLADVVAPRGARHNHRRRRQSPSRGLTNTCALSWTKCAASSSSPLVSWKVVEGCPRAAPVMHRSCCRCQQR